MSIAIKADKSLFELPKWGEDFTISEANYTTLDVSLRFNIFLYKSIWNDDKTHDLPTIQGDVTLRIVTLSGVEEGVEGRAMGFMLRLVYPELVEGLSRTKWLCLC